MTSLHFQACTELGYMYPFVSENEIALTQGAAACLLTSSFIAAFLAGWSPAAARMEEKDTDAFYQLLAGNFPTPQKTKAFCELFLSHSDKNKNRSVTYYNWLSRFWTLKFKGQEP